MKRFGMHITKNKIRPIAVLLVLSLAFSGCAAIDAVKDSATPASVKASQNAESTVEKKDFEHVIALSRSNAELWVLAGGNLAGTSDDALDIPGLNGDVVSLGDMDHASLEAVAALDPDLLILFATEPAQKALGEAAEEVGIPVYYTNIDTFDDYDAVMKEFTSYTGHPEKYEENVSKVRAQIDDVKNAVPEDGKGSTYLFLHVSSTKSKVEKNDYFACEIFDDLGLKNIAADDSSFDELSMEAIVSADPDYIFVVTRGDEQKALESFEQLFLSDPGWNNLSAVSEDRYYLLSKDLFGLKPNANWGQAYSEAYDLVYGE